MDKRALCSAVAASFILLGCAVHDGRGTPGGGMDGTHASCTGASCQIVVTVACTDSCTASANPKTLDVELPHGTKVILWKLDAPQGYAFADEKVQFESGAPFDCVRPGSGKREITCNDRHLATGMYSYKLDVVRTADPTRLISVDPWIVNR